MENLFELIGESAPYVEVYDVAVDNGVVYSRFKPEQQRYAETTLMSCSEGLRTMAVHGVMACAEANPIKSKHYYLANGGERYAVIEVDCVGLSEEEFVKLKGADAAPAVARVPGQPSPYVDPVRPMQLEWIRPGEELRATLEGFRREDFAGHFAIRAMCPVSILAGNACALIRHFPGFDAYLITRCALTCERASLPGETMHLRCVREQPNHFMVTAHNGKGKLLSTFHIDARAHQL